MDDGGAAEGTIAAAIAQLASSATPAARTELEALSDALAAFGAGEGWPLSEGAGRRTVALPLEDLPPVAIFRFVAVHLPVRTSLPLAALRRHARALGRLLRAEPRAGRPSGALARAQRSALRLASAELGRLDALARGLRAVCEGERPGPVLYRRDPAAYAAAMRAWAASRPQVAEAREGAFVVERIGEEALSLRPLAAGGAVEAERSASEDDGAARPFWLPVPPAVLALAREGDRIFGVFGAADGAMVLVESYSVAAGVPDSLGGAPPAG